MMEVTVKVMHFLIFRYGMVNLSFGGLHRFVDFPEPSKIKPPSFDQFIFLKRESKHWLRLGAPLSIDPQVHPRR